VDALNTLRAVLVGCAFVAAILLAVNGEWVPASVMFVGILAHFWLFKYLRDERRKAAEADPLSGLR
jgi:hypothetical protein